MEVEEEGDPRRRLVLRHRRYDGDVDLSVAEDRGRGRGRQTGCNSCWVVRVGSAETNYTIDPPD